MKNKNKPYIITLVIVFIFFIIIFFTVSLKSLKTKGKNLYLIVDQATTWLFENNKWKIIPANEYERYNWKQIKYYENGKFLGNNFLVYTNKKWYVFDKNKDAVNPGNTFLAVGGNIPINVLENKFLDTDSSDEKYIKNILSENNISDYDNFINRYKVVMDFDNDGQNEIIYVLNNFFSLDFSTETIYSFVVYVDSDQIYYLHKKTDKEKNVYDNCKAYVSNIIDVDSDNKYEIVLGCAYYSVEGVTNSMYTLKNKRYRLLISND